jgi:hypothetical protein
MVFKVFVRSDFPPIGNGGNSKEAGERADYDDKKAEPCP